MSAKELFEKVGYDYYEDDGIDCYLKAQCIPNKLNTEYIKFQKISFHRLVKEITINKYRKNAQCTEFIDSTDNDVIYLSIQELQAINQQCKELGWLDDNDNN